MTRQIINASDTLPASRPKINENFSELYARRLVRAGWDFATVAERDAAELTDDDIGFVCRVASPPGYFLLRQRTPTVVWEQLGGGAGPSPSTLWTPNNMGVAPSLMLSEQFVATKNGVRAWDHDPSRPSGLRFAPRGDAQAPLRMSRRGMDVVRFERVDGHALECGGAAALGLARSVQHGFALFVYRKTEADDLFHCLLAVGTGGAFASRFVLYAGGAGHGNRPLLYARRLDADADGILRDTADRGTDWQIVLAEMAWATGVASIIRNGASTGVSATITSGGSTSNTDSARPIAVGALSDGGLFFHASVELHAVVARFSNAALTTDERNRLFGWAAHRYALADLLPADHPFKSAPPTV